MSITDPDVDISTQHRGGQAACPGLIALPFDMYYRYADPRLKGHLRLGIDPPEVQRIIVPHRR